MKNTLLILCIAAILGAPAAGPAQDGNFNSAVLTDAGRNSYLELYQARAFIIGSSWGSLSSTQRALHQLLKEERSVEACKALIRGAGPAGKLYGFLGLRFSDPSVFADEVGRYKSLVSGSARNEEARKADEKAIFVSGCAQWGSDVREGVLTIESGEYDDEFIWGAKESESSPQHNNGTHPTRIGAPLMLELLLTKYVRADFARVECSGRYGANV